MQLYLRGCANQFQFQPSGSVGWATGDGAPDPVAITMALVLTANSSGDPVTVNGDPVDLPYTVQNGDVIAPITNGGGTMTFTATLDQSGAGVAAVVVESNFAAAVDGTGPFTVTITDNSDSGSGNSTLVRVTASLDGFFSAVASFTVQEAP